MRSAAELQDDPHYSGLIRLMEREATVREDLEHLVIACENIRRELTDPIPLRDPRQMLEE
jgi:hypothetical protein